jgi:exonuclease SbcC
VVNALDRLNRYLQNRAFKDFVMRRRERRLLGLSTEILRGMTGGRYGFAERFEILDGHTNRIRSAKTLSGGETFLASLALALALVEVASRTGGKLDALFLDEGFGNLDAATLDEALAKLAERASGGKLIGIITHVRGIAEQIDTILRVERRASGSVIERLEGSALASFMEDEVRAGLLAGIGRA